jgi:hypothetical protein
MSAELQAIDERLHRWGRIVLLAFLLAAACVGLVAVTAHAKQKKAHAFTNALCQEKYSMLHDPSDPFYTTDPAYRGLVQSQYDADCQ